MPRHLFRPPRQGEKEKKKKPPRGLLAAYQRFARGFGKFTEATDAMNCVYGALPEKLRKRERAKRHGKDPSIQGKLQLIYTHAADINVLSMLSCMATETAQDKIIGKASQRHAELRKQYGIRGGYLSRIPSFK